MAQRQAVTKANATRYKRAGKAGKGLILDELCATTGWHGNHARKALSQALTPRPVRPQRRRAGVVEIDLFGHEGGNALGEHCYTLDGDRHRDRLDREPIGQEQGREVGVRGFDGHPGRRSRSRSSASIRPTARSSINWHLLRWCEQNKTTFTRSRSGNGNDGAHVEHKN